MSGLFWWCFGWLLFCLLAPAIWVFVFRRYLSIWDKLQFVAICGGLVAVVLIMFFLPWFFI